MSNKKLYLQRAQNGNLRAAEMVAEDFLLENKFRQAVRYFSIAYKHGALNPRFGTYRLGLARFCAGDTPGALTIFRANYFMAARDPFVRKFLNRSYRDAFREAQKELIGYRFAGFMPGERPKMEAAFVAGLQSAAAGNFANAQRLFERCVHRSVNFGAAHLLLGMVAYVQDEQTAARAQWVLALESWEPQPPDTAGVTLYQAAAMVFLVQLVK